MPIRPSRLAFTACAVLAAGAAGAQDIVELPTLTVEGDANRGFFGETFAQSAGSVMKTDTPILDTPRSVSVVTQQQIAGARRAERHAGAAVHAGRDGRLSAATTTAATGLYVRGFEPTHVPRRAAVLLRLLQQRPAGALPARHVAVLKGPAGMLYGNGAVGGIVNASSKLPDPSAPNIVQLEFGTNDLFQSGIDVGGALGPDGKLLYRLVGLGRSADGPVDYSNDDAAAFMPSLTWMPTDAHAGDRARLLPEERHQPDASSSCRPTARSGRREAVRERRLPARETSSSASRASTTTTPSARRCRSSPTTASTRSGRRRHRCATPRASVDYAQVWWAYDNFDTGRYNPDGTDQPRRARLADNDSHAWVGDLHATADFALGADAARRDVRRRLHRRPFQLRLRACAQPTARSTRSTRSIRAWRRAAGSSTIPSTR